MNLTRADIVWGLTLGAAVGIAYHVGQTLWGGGALADLTPTGLLSAAFAGAAAGLLAFMLRKGR